MFCQKLGYVVRVTRVFEVWAPLDVWTGGVSPFLPACLVHGVTVPFSSPWFSFPLSLSGKRLGRHEALIPHSFPDERIQGRPCHGFGDLRLGRRTLKAMVLQAERTPSFLLPIFILRCHLGPGDPAPRLGLCLFLYHSLPVMGLWPGQEPLSAAPLSS